MARPATAIVGGALALAALAWGVNFGLQRLALSRPVSTPHSQPQAAPETAHITATLYFATPDGLKLAPVRREVPLAVGVLAQGQEILRAQLQPAPPPYVSVIPPGTALRAFYVTERGDAFVDLTGEVSRNHPGGSHTELLTVQAIVHAVAANLPGVERVQILVDGHEADAIAGHIDIRRPFERDPSMVLTDSKPALQ